MARERSDSGEFVESVTLATVVEVFGEVEGPVVTSADVADALACSRETARRKLSKLHRQGCVERRKTAGRVVWWLTEGETPAEREREYLKSFGKYADTNIAETAEAVSERFDRDLRERREQRASDER